MTNTMLLNKKIDDSGYKRIYIAKAIGLKSAYGLAKKIRNETEFKASEINALCELLKIDDPKEKEAIFFAVYNVEGRLRTAARMVPEKSICRS